MIMNDNGPALRIFPPACAPDIATQRSLARSLARSLDRGKLAAFAYRRLDNKTSKRVVIMRHDERELALPSLRTFSMSLYLSLSLSPSNGLSNVRQCDNIYVVATYSRMEG